MGIQIDPTTLNDEGIILWFDDLGTDNEDFAFLSNFYKGDPIILPGVVWQGDYATDKHGFASTFDNDPAPLEYPYELKGKPVEFPTGEHAFAAMKVKDDPLALFDIVHASDPNAAKGLGRSVDLRADWEEVKYDAMAAVIRAKFTGDRKEARWLVERTGDRMLVEGTFWKDRVWGVDLRDPELSGRNWLGTLLMARRAELRAWARFPALSQRSSDRVTYFANVVKESNMEFVGP